METMKAPEWAVMLESWSATTMEWGLRMERMTGPPWELKSDSQSGAAREAA